MSNSQRPKPVNRKCIEDMRENVNMLLLTLCVSFKQDTKHLPAVNSMTQLGQKGGRVSLSTLRLLSSQISSLPYSKVHISGDSCFVMRTCYFCS